MDDYTQTNLIVQHLVAHNRITSIEAINLYGATRIGSIIYNLRHKRGYPIATEMVTGITRFGRPQRYGVYTVPKGWDPFQRPI